MKHPHKLRHGRRKAVVLQRITIPAEIRRDIILEHDQVYASNLQMLCRRILSGKVPQVMFNRIQPNLAMAALRRAGVNMRESTRLLHA
jgi:hypothetical protein